MAFASPTEQSEPQEVEENYTIVRYKVYVLKVLIHCQGCSKTIKKDLMKIDGVYKIEVDSVNHIVTVFANVEPEQLIKKLKKNSKRYVELCTSDDNQKLTETNEQQSHQAERKEKQKEEEKEKEREAETTKVTNQEVKRAMEKGTEQAETAQVPNHSGGGGEANRAMGKGKAVKVVEERVKHFEVGNCSNSKNVEVEECNVAKPNVGCAGQSKEMKTGKTGGVAEYEGGNGAAAGSGFGGEKKKAGKGLNINVNTSQSEVMGGALPPILESAPVHFRPQQPQPPPQEQPIPFPANFNPAMHYHAVPKLSHCDLRHVPRPVYTSPIHSHWGLGPEIGGTRDDEPSSYYLQNLPPPQLSPVPPAQDPERPYYASPSYADSFALLSDENSNACNIM